MKGMLLAVLAFLLILWGFFLQIGVLANWAEGEFVVGSLFGDLVFNLFFSVVPLLLGGYIFYSRAKKMKAKGQTQQSIAIISLAQTLGGKMTIAEVVTNLHIDVIEANNQMNLLQDQGVFELQLSDSGTMVYVLNASFGGDKSGAKALLD